MAYFQMDLTKPHAGNLYNVINALTTSRRSLNDHYNTMTQMLLGDGSQDAHYATIATQYGFPDNGTAHAAYSELSADNGSQQGINASQNQLADRFR